MMFNNKLINRLDSIIDLPSIPAVLSEVLDNLDNLDINPKTLAKIIEKDQSLTAKILKVANSSFYGFARTISTIDLGIIVLGLNSIKEIVLTLLLKKFFTKINTSLFNIQNFWHYSVYCGAASKYLAKKFDYRFSGEAFIAGLMHDIGILILIHFFKNEFKEIQDLQMKKKISMKDAEIEVINTHHGEIGFWLAEKWQLPTQLCSSIKNHHNNYVYETDKILTNDNLTEPLTVVVSIAEWFAGKTELKRWSKEQESSPLYFKEEFIDLIMDDSILDHESAVEKLRSELNVEFEKALESHSIL